jgi:PBP1b-binding outer membrane lipoprotein LpoB
MAKRVGIVAAVALAVFVAGGCSKHPTAEEREKHEQERDQQLMMQKLLEIELSNEREAGALPSAPSDSAATKALKNTTR